MAQSNFFYYQDISVTPDTKDIEIQHSISALEGRGDILGATSEEVIILHRLLSQIIKEERELLTPKPNEP